MDSNGRTSRLLSTLCLYRAGYDFKRLFTLSEYYDRNRASFYRALEEVRERGMNVTGWLEYFVEGLATQLGEVQVRGAQAMRLEMLAAKFSLSARQTLALEFVGARGTMIIQDFERLCPGVHRRTLQRDIKHLIEKGLLETAGATNQLVYRAEEASEQLEDSSRPGAL